jgi:hypothetical protein
MLRLAATEIAPITATGIANRRGHGVAITITERKRVAWPLIAQARTPMETARGVYQAPSKSPMRRNCGRLCCDSSTTRMMLA